MTDSYSIRDSYAFAFLWLSSSFLTTCLEILDRLNHFFDRAPWVDLTSMAGMMKDSSCSPHEPFMEEG
jgi:hypothetical protein